MTARRISPAGPLLRALGAPLLLAVLVIAAFAAARLTGRLDRYGLQMERAEGALLGAAGVWLVHRVIDSLMQWAQRGGSRALERAVLLIPLGRRALGVVSLVIGLLVVLDQLRIPISPLLAGLGISGIAVALALQPLLTNLFAGSYVLSDSSIRIGDYITIQGGPSGRVEDIGWRAARLRDVGDGSTVIVPNATLASATVTNLGRSGTTAVTVTLPLPRQTDLDAFEREAAEALRGLAGDRRGESPLVRFSSIDADTVTCVITLQAASPDDAPALRHALVKALAPLSQPRLGKDRGTAAGTD